MAVAVILYFDLLSKYTNISVANAGMCVKFGMQIDIDIRVTGGQKSHFW